ncbi:hypothetical protein B0H21DRAFT_764787 [Amylocystis lapponica]|nr:hypothetical protein B0H21DRAFT_764787 [Amylocystis lapponica]
MADDVLPREFPQEMCDRIVDHLWNDRTALRACSLTCRSWLPTARLHLFHTVRVDPNQSGNPYITETPLPRLTNIAPYVRNLTLYRKETSSAAPPTAFPSWLKKFKNVEHLIVQHNGRTWMTEVYRRGLISSFPRVKTLHLHCVHFDDCEDLWETLQGFPRLSTLHVDGVHAAYSPFKPPASDAPSIDIQNLCLRHVNLDMFVAWLTKPPFELHLRKIELGSRNEVGKKQVVLSMLEQSTDTLEVLTIAPSTMATLVKLKKWHPFLHKTSLRALCLTGMVLSGYPGFKQTDASAILDILAHVNSTRLEQVVFAFTVEDLDHVSQLNWKQIDERLASLAAGEPRRGLSVIINVTRKPDSFKNVFKFTRTDMKLHIKGLLLKARKAGVKLQVSVA